jgi:hypothetical protein
MTTLPPGSGEGRDLRELLSDTNPTDTDCLARLAPGPFPVIPEREWCVEVYQELLDARNYVLGGAATCPVPLEHHPDWQLWLDLRAAVLTGCSIARELCRRRDEREGRLYG